LEPERKSEPLPILEIPPVPEIVAVRVNELGLAKTSRELLRIGPPIEPFLLELSPNCNVPVVMVAPLNVSFVPERMSVPVPLFSKPLPAISVAMLGLRPDATVITGVAKRCIVCPASAIV
jgi:hypothetical protein